MTNYSIYRYCVKFLRVWRSNVQKHPWRLKVMPWNDFVCLSIFRQVLRVHFIWNSCETWLNHIIILFGLETSMKTSPSTNKGSFRKNLCWWPKLPKAVHLRMAIDGQCPSLCPVGGGRNMILLMWRKNPSYKSPNRALTYALWIRQPSMEVYLHAFSL